MRLNGNRYSAVEDRMGNITITRKRDLASVYLQGDDAVEFLDNHRILEAVDYPSGPFKTLAEHVDVCLDAYADALDTAEQHEDILAGLANERPHSRIKQANGIPCQWTYDGRRGMVR
jgi:hypothetical protein